MNNPTTAQKAQLYDDALEELQHRFKKATRNATKTSGSEFFRGQSDGQYFAYKEAIELLASKEGVEYTKRPRAGFWFWAGMAFGSFVLFYSTIYALSVFGWI